MNKVYLVDHHVQYEGGNIKAVYSDPEDAESHARELVEKRLEGRGETMDDVSVWRDASENHVVSYQLGSSTWVVTERNVK